MWELTRARVEGREAGFALPTVLLTLVVLAVLGMGAFTVARDEFKSADWMRESSMTMYAAEAGVNHVFATWITNDYGALMQNPGDSADLGWITIPENNASFHAVLRRIDNGTGDKKYTVGVTGRGQNASTGIRRTIVAQARESGGGGGGAFPYTIMVADKTKSSGGIINGDVRSNDEITTGGGGITGNATASGTVSDHSLVGGTVTEGAPQLPLDTIPCPPQPYGPDLIGTDHTFDPVKGIWKLSGGTATMPGGTYFFNEFITSGSSAIQIPVGETVVLYIEKTLKTSGDGFVNPAPNTADNMQVYQCGSLVGAWTFTGPSTIHMGIYAPLSKITMSGGGDRYGNFVAWQFDKSGGGNLYFEPSLTHHFTGSGGTPTVTRVANSWWEVQF